MLLLPSHFSTSVHSVKAAHDRLVDHDKCFESCVLSVSSQCLTEKSGDEKVNIKKPSTLFVLAFWLFYGRDHVSLRTGSDDMMIYCDVIERERFYHTVRPLWAMLQIISIGSPYTVPCESIRPPLTFRPFATFQASNIKI
ncbi:hypothetical protein PFLUV_G00012490 [Perca fluviatilis]|uniref:Uncharacterized protein n=1 Tax=Perca fluviatilis TaxID=8168 RepID=A0A6A5FS99_PERFL|nr:hypothetical protein PFLUV_G00012490 [Perca fluviatilis]